MRRAVMTLEDAEMITVAFADQSSICARYGPDCVLSPAINNLQVALDTGVRFPS